MSLTIAFGALRGREIGIRSANGRAVNSTDHSTIRKPAPLRPIKQRHLACLWRAPNSVTSAAGSTRAARRRPEITRWHRTKYAIKVTVIRADRKPICRPPLPPSLPLGSDVNVENPIFTPPATFAIVLRQFSRCAVPPTASFLAVHFAVLRVGKKKRGGGWRRIKTTKKGRGAARLRPGARRPSDRWRREGRDGGGGGGGERASAA